MEASLQKKNNLYKILGDTIKEFTPIFLDCTKSLSLVNQKSDSENKRHAQNILRVLSSALYKAIEMSVYLRASLRTDIVVEKRMSLKYIVLAAHEFYKQIFLPAGKKHSLWDKVSSYLLSIDDDSIKIEMEKINEAISKFQQKYYDDNNKNKRNITAHYDNPQAMYKYYLDISEEEEAQRICAALELVKPIITMLKPYMLFVNSDIRERNISFRELHEIISLRHKLYLYLGEQLIDSANRLDKLMRKYALPDKIIRLLPANCMDEIYAFRDYANTGILLQFVNLDLLAAVKAYLSSEFTVELRINLVRLYLSMYEALKKICFPHDNTSKSLFEQYICEPISALGDENLKSSLEHAKSEIENIRRDYQEMEPFRNKYVHFDKGFKTDKFANDLLKLNNREALEKSLRFIKLSNLLIKLNGKVLKMKTEKIYKFKSMLGLKI